MLFSSLTFLYLFLPLTLAAYSLIPGKGKIWVLLLSSLGFYFYGEPRYTLLLLFSSLTDWLFALYMERHREDGHPRAALIGSIGVNLLLLGTFKYADFLIGSVNGILGTAIPQAHLPLPIGISFFTFQTMSYTVDVYLGRAKAEKSLLRFAAYVSLYPQLVAGPIVRYEEIREELHHPAQSWRMFARGVRRFLLGLGKKVLLANLLGELHGKLAQGSGGTVAGALVMAIAYMLQIYFDFSGYSDMAIGLGAMLGFSFPENFQYPFLSKSITEFWRRWHMTLSRWFRDYLYIPLGGSREGRGKMVRNILIVWAATGLWHGASWNFVLWGLYFGVLLLLEKLAWGKWLEKLPGVLRHGYTLVLVLISFVLFANENLGTMTAQLRTMFGGGPLYNRECLYYIRSYGPVLLLAALGSMPLGKIAWEKLRKRMPIPVGILEIAGCLLLLGGGTALLVDGSFNPFLYFRF